MLTCDKKDIEPKSSSEYSKVKNLWLSPEDAKPIKKMRNENEL